MARIRTFKPELFKSLDVSPLPLRARWTWLGLWSQCDDHGRFQDHVKLIKGEVWPLDDVSLRDVAEDLDTLADHGRIVRYAVAGRDYLAVQNWHHHQSINRPGKPKYPAPPVPIGVPEPGEPNHCAICWELFVELSTDLSTREDSLSAHGGLTPGREGKGREQGGDARARASPPSPRCQRHQEDPNPPPCGPCKDARLMRERWDRETKEAAKDAGLAIRRCQMCDPDGYEYEPGTRIPKTPWVKCEHRPLRSVS